MSDANVPILITGVGLACPLGLGVEQTWRHLLAGRSAMGPMSAMETPLPPGRDGGQTPDLPPDYAPELPRETRYLKWTLDAALTDADIDPAALSYAPARCAVIMGTTLHGMRAGGRFLRSGDFTHLGAFLAGPVLDAAMADLPFTGFSATTCSACSSSLGSIALGVTLLQTGHADLVIAGGYDTISEYVYGGFSSLRLVAEGSPRPFCKNRQGMKLAEGYGAVVLERAENFHRRVEGKRKSVAAVLGWGESSDAHHLTQPHPQGDGAARAIVQALVRAHLKPADIDLIAAHGTGTPDNDAAEYGAFARVFGDGLPRVPVVAFKSHLGHTLGAAGVVELILSATARATQTVPPTANVSPDQLEFAGLAVTHGAAKPGCIRSTLNTSLGFGGANTCIILGDEPQTAAPQVMQRSTEVFITGVGVVLPDAIGNEAFVARLSNGADVAPPKCQINESDLQHLLAARRVRRMSEYVKFMLAAATLACRHAGIDDLPAFAHDCSAILGATHGATVYSTELYRLILKEGLSAANPMLFAESVPNVAAAQLSLMLSLQGACQTIIGSRGAGLDAISLAAARIRSGAWSRAIVGAGEEYSELVSQAYRHCGLARQHCDSIAPPFASEAGFVPGAGAVVFVLESAASMSRRGKTTPRGRITGTAASHRDRASSPRAAIDVLEQLSRPENVISSACATWIDRAEAAALDRCGAEHVSSMAAYACETFSATPLVGLAATLLTGKLPSLAGMGLNSPPWTCRTEIPVTSVTALCTDFTGAVRGVSISMERI